MQTVEGYLNKIIFHNKENNYYILSIFLNDQYDFAEGDYLSVVGTFNDFEFVEDELYAFKGEIVQHRKYGTQLSAIVVEPVIEKDKEAIESFLQEVEERTMTFNSEIKRLKYLVDNHYYYDLFKDYNEEEIIELSEYTLNYDFKFESFMAASKFYKDYALKTNNKKKYLENYNQHVFIVGLFLADGDIKLAKELIDSMLEQRYQPATPTFLNAGRARRGEFVSCFLLSTGDSLNSINYVENTSIPVAKSLELGFAYADQLGQRPGAGAAYLNIFHYDVLDFLDTKKVNADESLRLPTLSTGLVVPSFFFELAKENKDFYMFGPHSILREYGLNFSEIDIEKYYEDFWCF